MRRIAVASTKGEVSGHFGHCESFMLFEVQDNQIVSEEAVPNPGHRRGFLPRFLHDLGVDVVVAGGMGSGAAEFLESSGTEVVTGVTGPARTVVEAYLRGELQSSGVFCREHKHHGDCGEHHGECDH